ncbi:MAG: SusC/RagA family TonB-linked outer membrane protein [Chlorobi bacterium]|nr:SusC/RagA family TonB-linked outer membrane protein [Chlorobiota bacterium]MBX7216040.1 SusC/RagA family TonB-linked outer membrane protein [Candidatus Kapabacteria bacterium]
MSYRRTLCSSTKAASAANVHRTTSAGRLLSTAALLFLAATGLQAQNTGTIQGSVTDADTKSPVTGATVQVVGQKIGAITDRNGKFTIRNVPAGKVSVEARAIGYTKLAKSADVKSGETADLSFSLRGVALQQNEIVVVGLSGATERKKLGNTIGSVDGEQVARAVTPSAIDAISGRVTGVTVTRTNGVPGAGTYVTIRGRKTISGSSEPLYIVDGVVIDNSSQQGDLFQGGNVQLSNRAVDINPSDIESMEVLKGASAAAIYGSLAANGVVIITTKKGKAIGDKPRVTLSTAYQTDNKVGEVPLQRIYGQTIPYKPGQNGEPGTPGGSQSYGAKLADGTPTYDHSSDVFRTGESWESTLSVSGGAGLTNYLISGTWLDQEGFVIGSELDRKSVRMNIGTQVLPNVMLQSNSNYIQIDNDLPQNGSNTAGILLGGLRTPPEFNSLEYLEPDGTQRRFAAYDNPIWTQHNNKFNTNINRFIHSSKVSIDMFDWLNLGGVLGVDRYDHRNLERLAVGSAASDGRLGQIRHFNFSTSNINLDLTANVDYKFTDDLLVEVTLGSQILWGKATSDVSKSTQTLSFFDEVKAGASIDAESSTAESKTVGLFAQATATLMDRLSLTLAVRRDGSSTFGTSKQFHTYPKASLAYTLSDESFMEGTKDVISNVRLRGSYGAAGSPSLPGAYATNILYNTAGFPEPWSRQTSAGRNGQIGIKQGPGDYTAFVTTGNTNIEPERNTEYEFGIDLGFLNDMIGIEATFYHSDITNMILWTPVPGSSGFDQQLRNSAEMWNEGVEIGISASPVRTEDFTWSTNINYTKNTNMVTKLSGAEFVQLEGGFTGAVNVGVEGKPLGAIRATGWLRDINGNRVYSGDIYTDKNGNLDTAEDYFGNPYKGTPVIDPDQQIVGYTDPDFQVSWSNDFRVLKNLSIGFLFDASFGQDVWNGTRGALYNFGTHADTKDRDELWVNDRGEKVMDISNPDSAFQITRKSYYRQYANSFLDGPDEAHVEDGSYIKLREVHAEYTFDGLPDWGIPISQATIGVAIRNLLTISDYSGYDPEVNNFQQAEGRGFDYFTLPQTRSLRFNLSLTY